MTSTSDDPNTEPEAKVRDVAAGDFRRDHLHPSKWPFALVYMDAVPKNAAGKPLRIKLAARLGLGKLSDAIPPFQRHYEVARRDLPSKEAALSEPIPCARVALDLNAIHTALTGVARGGQRYRRGARARAAGVHRPIADPHAGGAAQAAAHAAWRARLPGMEHTVARARASAMSEHALFVWDTIGNLLVADAALIKPESDFFLGGNSLLLGKLAYQIRRQTGVAIGVASLFTNSTIEGIAGLIEEEHRKSGGDALPFVFFYPLKTALTVARHIGRYKTGTYRMWSTYHLRWWIVNQSLRIAGRGIFAMHPSLEILYYRLLGARVGRNVRIDKCARLGEYDLLTFCDGCRVHTALVRGFAVEREGYFRLDKVVIGEKAVVNTFTQIVPGARIPNGAVYGPHASSRDSPSPRA
ncbi:hypothetical protein B0H14DRAFT_2635351 [Mycena olivaceomarginata]|nr:hypothetical protein B0H14DRAFT_2635351 [Mycena olivaceomarginata]